MRKTDTYKTLAFAFLFLRPLFPQGGLGATTEKPIDPPGSIEALQELAIKNNADLKAAAYDARSMAAGAESQSMFASNPEFSVGLNNVPTGSFPSINADNMSSYSIMLSQKIALPWESSSRQGLSSAMAVLSNESFLLKRAELKYKVAELANAITFFRNNRRLLKELQPVLKSALGILAASAKPTSNLAGQILDIRADLASLENDIIQTELDENAAWLELEKFCGVAFNHDLPPGVMERWDVRPAAAEAKFEPRESLLHRIFVREVEIRKMALAQAESRLFPEITVGASYMFRQKVPGMTQGEDMVSVSVSTPLPLFYTIKEKNEISSKSAELNAARSKALENDRRLAADAGNAALTIDAMNKAIENLENQILPAHQSSHRAHLSSQSVSGMGSAEALIAFREYTQMARKRLEYIKKRNSAVNKLAYLRTKGTVKK